MREDLSLLRFLADIFADRLPELAPFSLRELVAEFAEKLLAELDFTSEAALTEKAARLFDNRDGIRLPRIHWEYTAAGVLVEEKLPGTTLAQLIATAAPGDYDGVAVAEILTRSFLTQYFQQGFFHSDPHAGNLLLLPSGEIGIIDWGQVGQLSAENRRDFLALLTALEHGDDELVAVILAAMAGGENRREFTRALRQYLDKFWALPFAKIRLQVILDGALALARRHQVQLPPELSTLVKSAATLHGVLCRLAPQFTPEKILRQFIADTVKNLLLPPKLLWGGAAFLFRFFGAVKSFPENFRALLDKASAGKARVIFHHEGLETIGDQVERASNRLTLGILIAAILLGSSIMLATVSGATFTLTLPWLGAVPLSEIIAGAGYLFAMVLGVWLAWAILRGKRL
jgi:ubiquinone biosynthesis protein